MMNKEKVRILVLDDEPFMLKLLGTMLSNLGFKAVTLCPSGAAAMKIIDRPQEWPDLILVDLNMPGMDGVEFVRKLAEHGYAGSLIVVSGEDERMLQTAHKLVKAHRIDVLGYLHKPVAPQLLSALIDTWESQVPGSIRAVKKIYSADRIRTAIEENEFINYYQPKVDIASGRVLGVETLVRWRHPEDGMVFPDQFIAIAEAEGIIDLLTRWVMTEALAQARRWHLAGLDLCMAVNVSMDNLASLPFVDFVVEQAALVQVPPQQVMLEVTESRLMKDQRTPLEILTRLRLKRFGLSIDDFGTGHSSLAQLRDIPFDELKIDQSFVHGGNDNETLRAILNASQSLAKQLGMQVVAEGVEDLDDWTFLRRSRCDLAQGYFIARPMPAGNLPAWLETWAARLPELLAVPVP